MLNLLPYKRLADSEGTAKTPDGVLSATDHNGLWFSQLERPVNPGLTQSVECDPYKVEVAGSSPAARTIPSSSTPTKRTRKEYLRDYQREWIRRRRDSFFVGKSCHKCGSADSLELHHRNPKEKVSHRIWSWAEGRRAPEIAKCEILCRECHLLITRATAVSYNARPHGTRGVRFVPRKLKNPWSAAISYFGRSLHLGYFPTPEEAASAYDRKAVEFYGSIATTNLAAHRSPSISTTPVRL